MQVQPAFIGPAHITDHDADDRSLATAENFTGEEKLIWCAEPGWSAKDFEALREDEPVAVLGLRMRELVAWGLDPATAIVSAARLEQPFF